MKKLMSSNNYFWKKKYFIINLNPNKKNKLTIKKQIKTQNLKFKVQDLWQSWAGLNDRAHVV